MIVYGGELNTGKVTDEILTLNLTNLEWIRVEVLKPCKKGIYHGACAAVFRDKNLIQTFTETTQPSYKFYQYEGVYFFGGLNVKGELQNKLRLLKPYPTNGLVRTAQWTKVQGCFIGKPPCPRYGHTMNYLPIS